MSRRSKLYEGKAKIIYEGPESGTVVHYYKDDATAFNNKKHDVIAGKGILNNRISAHLMTKLEAIGVPTHFIRSLNMREQLTHEVTIVPIELVVRNIAAGSLCKRLGLEEGHVLPKPLIEFYYKDDNLGDPMVNEDHIVTMGWADPYELEEMLHLAGRINDYLNGLFDGIGLTLVDFKLEFGRLWGEYGELYILLSDEISPDTCRLWDKKTKEKYDKDRFRQDLGGLIEAYQEVAVRLGLIPREGIIKEDGVNEKLAEALDDIENKFGSGRNIRSLHPSKPKKGQPKTS
jgi:phosphoribosylaminoimidazole-succinocarboxamide synthase